MQTLPLFYRAYSVFVSLKLRLLTFFSKTASATSRTIFLKLFYTSFTLLNFRLSSFIFNCSCKVSLKFSSCSIANLIICLKVVTLPSFQLYIKSRHFKMVIFTFKPITALIYILVKKIKIKDEFFN